MQVTMKTHWIKMITIEYIFPLLEDDYYVAKYFGDNYINILKSNLSQCFASFISSF